MGTTESLGYTGYVCQDTIWVRQIHGQAAGLLAKSSRIWQHARVTIYRTKNLPTVACIKGVIMLSPGP
jgi:hypothetical protein